MTTMVALCGPSPLGPPGEKIMTSYSFLKHPLVGELLMIANPTELIGVHFADRKRAPAIQRNWKLNPKQAILKEASRQIQDYLSGRRTSFSIPFHSTGTAFQLKIWREIASIPFGETISYSELARRAGAPRAVRAAGSAAGKNPLCILTPCHRVVAKDGTLGGFGGGLARKKRLLAVEKNQDFAGESQAHVPAMEGRPGRQ